MKKLIGNLNELFYSAKTLSLLTYPTTVGLSAVKGYYVMDGFCTIIMGGSTNTSVKLNFPIPKTTFDLIYTSNNASKTVTGFNGSVDLSANESFEITTYYEVK